MADSAAFEAACTCLEQSGALDRLAARGTIRLALKQAGFDAKTVAGRELAVAVERLLPAELAARGVSDSAGLCRRITEALEAVEGGIGGVDTPERVFARLGGA